MHNRDDVPWEVVELEKGCIIRACNGPRCRYPCLYYLRKEVADHLVKRHNAHLKRKQEAKER